MGLYPGFGRTRYTLSFGEITLYSIALRPEGVYSITPQIHLINVRHPLLVLSTCCSTPLRAANCSISTAREDDRLDYYRGKGTALREPGWKLDGTRTCGVSSSAAVGWAITQQA